MRCWTQLRYHTSMVKTSNKLVGSVFYFVRGRVSSGGCDLNYNVKNRCSWFTSHSKNKLDIYKTTNFPQWNLNPKKLWFLPLRHTAAHVKYLLSYFTGYGGIAPSTSTGRIFCVIYALVGIPLCLVYISALGRQLFKASERLCIRASSCRHRKWVPLLAYILLGGLFSIWMAAVIFAFVENWAYTDAVYFIFITLSTIGFGDFVPGRYCVKH